MCSTCTASPRLPPLSPVAVLKLSAARITLCWDGPLGAVRELLRPSWFTAAPDTASTAAEDESTDWLECGAGAMRTARHASALRRGAGWHGVKAIVFENKALLINGW